MKLRIKFDTPNTENQRLILQRGVLPGLFALPGSCSIHGCGAVASGGAFGKENSAVCVFCFVFTLGVVLFCVCV